MCTYLVNLSILVWQMYIPLYPFCFILSGIPVGLMENNDADKKETDESTPQRRCKPKVKFAPKVLPKKMPKIIPKREPHEENKVLTIDKKVMTGIGSFQITDNPRSGAKAEKQGTPVRFHLDEQTLQFQGLSPLQEALQQALVSFLISPSLHTHKLVSCVWQISKESYTLSLV